LRRGNQVCFFPYHFRVLKILNLIAFENRFATIITTNQIQCHNVGQISIPFGFKNLVFFKSNLIFQASGRVKPSPMKVDPIVGVSRVKSANQSLPDKNLNESLKHLQHDIR